MSKSTNLVRNNRRGVDFVLYRRRKRFAVDSISLIFISCEIHVISTLISIEIQDIENVQYVWITFLDFITENLQTCNNELESL